MEFAQFLDPYQDVFYELFRLCKIAILYQWAVQHVKGVFQYSSLAVRSIESKHTKGPILRPAQSSAKRDASVFVILRLMQLSFSRPAPTLFK